ncbi:MAG: 23S rRNA (adenine(2503)-C(2))-methyltransferase RlmN [Clostridiales bacterium]|nr:23S rRNA (adenine(2503)-C(2))-methyltransferase RlmN [Clostridiales bacterium]
MKKQNLLELTIEELKAFAAGMGEPPFRGKQLFRWMNQGVKSFDNMTDLSLSFREELKKRAYLSCTEIIKVQEDKKDGTKKFLFALEDGNAVEGVYMKYKYGNSLCISSQVGCKMGCSFCASALGGFVRNLSSAEMMGQVLEAEGFTGEKINHVVVMGMGEPLDNYENLRRFLINIHEPSGKNMSYRNITVSTSGILPAMRRFAVDFPQVNLAVSLHSLDDEERSIIMPVNKIYALEDLLRESRSYTEATGRRITFEYTLIKGRNDGDAHLRLMKEKLRGMLCHVNLIPLNAVDETGYVGSGRRRAEEMAADLAKAGIPATVRRELGREIDGACGQLRRRH